MASFKTSYKFLAFLGLSLIVVNCSVEKNTDTTRFYHSMTARFNIYFNGYESFKTGLLKITNGYKDDYAELLNVFEYSDPGTVSVCSSDMERAIQKASKLISLKSITAKPEIKDNRQLSEREKALLDRKEYNDWVDDSYLLIGKARFYKHEFSEAASLFNYSVTEANDPMIKTEALIWLARINNETGFYIESLRILSDIDPVSDLSKALKAMYYTTMADLFIKQKRYSEAVEPLSRAVEHASKKRTRYRLTYLLAQLCERSGDDVRATALYKKVVKMNPPYEVEFNARINIAGVFDINSGNPSDIMKELEKMLKDAKNKDFLDQIYFAMGNLSMREGKEAEALEYFRKSATASSMNQNQKGRSYLALAGYYYDKPDYMKAGRYYDSAVYFLDQKYPDYRALQAKSQNLNALVSQLTVIQTEDSLQKVAGMSEQERDALISKIIARVVKDETEGTSSGSTDRYSLGQFYENERRFQGNIEQEGKWYFYNQAALTFGRTEFRRRWGERKLEDNWRRSNKTRLTTSPTVAGNEVTSPEISDTSSAMLNNKSPEFYLKNLPLTDSLINISNLKIASALLNAGKAYAEQIMDIPKASETFESLIERFPGTEFVPEALYNLYRINREDNSARAEYYRQRLLGNYPESEFARILSDPGYYEKKLADIKMAESMYEEAYNLYNQEKFSNSISLCEEALTKFPKDPLAPKFSLLKAYSTGKVSDERTFKDELATIVKSWPGSDESKRASEIIAFLNKEIPELKVEEDKVIAAELYRADTTLNHVFVLVINDPGFNINLATFDVISYNIDNYTNNNYRTTGMLVDNRYIMITVSGFPDYSKAAEYFRTFRSDQIVRNPSGSEMMTFIISNENLIVLNKDKDPGRYQLFFVENYMK